MQISAHKVRSAIGLAFAFGAALVIAIGAFEVAVDNRLRFRPGAPSELANANHPAARRSQTLDTRFSPPVEYAHDEFGGRAATTAARYERARTVALVGDSFTYGDEREFPNTLQAKLANALDANVVNFARAGSCSAYFAETVTEFRKRYQKPIDVLVVGLFPDMEVGDLPRVLATRREYGRISYRGLDMSPTTARVIQESFWQRSLLGLEVSLRERSSTFNTLFPPRPSPAFAVSLKNTLTPAMFPDLLASILANLSALEASSEVPANRTVVWFAASLHDAGKRDTEYVRLSDELWSEISSALRGLGYIVVDPRLDVGAGTDPFTRSGHYRPAAYEITARAVIPEVTRILLDRHAAK